MITEKDAEKALDFLIATVDDLAALIQQARMKDSLKKHIHALLMKQSNESSVAAQERDAYAHTKYLEAITEDAIAAAELVKIKARRDNAETTISLYQSLVKDRQGARP